MKRQSLTEGGERLPLSMTVCPLERDMQSLCFILGCDVGKRWVSDQFNKPVLVSSLDRVLCQVWEWLCGGRGTLAGWLKRRTPPPSCVINWVQPRKPWGLPLVHALLLLLHAETCREQFWHLSSWLAMGEFSPLRVTTNRRSFTSQAWDYRWLHACFTMLHHFQNPLRGFQMKSRFQNFPHVSPSLNRTIPRESQAAS